MDLVRAVDSFAARGVQVRAGRTIIPADHPVVKDRPESFEALGEAVESVEPSESEPPESEHDRTVGSETVVPPGTVQEVLAWVGDDRDRAALAREYELQRGSVRQTLLDALDVVEGEDES